MGGNGYVESHSRTSLVARWRQISNNLNSTACRGRHCRQLGRLCCRYALSPECPPECRTSFRLCRQCVPGFTVFVALFVCKRVRLLLLATYGLDKTIVFVVKL